MPPETPNLPAPSTGGGQIELSVGESALIGFYDLEGAGLAIKIGRAHV